MSPAYPKPTRKRKRAPAAPSPSVRADVVRRDGIRCRWCGGPVRLVFGEYSLQHRRARGMGGTVRPEANMAGNLVLVHGTGTTGCHGEIESNPIIAEERGFRVAQGNDPASIPLLVKDNPMFGALVQVWIDNEGGATRTPPKTQSKEVAA
jgi:hypothetical protein